MDTPKAPTLQEMSALVASFKEAQKDVLKEILASENSICMLKLLIAKVPAVERKSNTCSGLDSFLGLKIIEDATIPNGQTKLRYANGREEYMKL